MAPFVYGGSDGVEFANVSGSPLETRAKGFIVISNGMRILEKNNTHGCARSVYLDGEGKGEIKGG